MTLSPALLFVLALVALVVGPLAWWASRGSGHIKSGMEGFVLVAVTGLVLIHVLPESVASAGAWAILALVVGMIVPSLAERWLGVSERRAHTAFLCLGLLALAVHAAVDGVVLGAVETHSHGHAHGLPAAAGLAVILHRIAVGLAIWVLARPRFGAAGAVGILGGIGAATALGFFASTTVVEGLSATGLAVFQAFVSGSLLHVLVHRHNHAERSGGEHDNHDHYQASSTFGEAVGGLIGLALLAYMVISEGQAAAGAHAHHHHAVHSAGIVGWAERLLGLAVETAPALLLGYALAGAAMVMLPNATVRWLNRGRGFMQAGRGVALGAPLPICSCGVLPVYQGLVQRGTAPTAAMAFLVATPEVGIEAMLLSVPLIGWELTAMRLGSALIVALVIGVVVGRFVVASGQSGVATGAVNRADFEGAPFAEKAGFALRYGFRKVVDDTAPWILLGLAIAAAIEPESFGAVVAAIPAGTDVLVFAVIGIPTYVCATGATPIAAALIFAGVSPGAGITFLLAGPATNITTFGVLSKLHDRRVAVLFAASVLTGAVAAGYAVNALTGVVTIHTGEHVHGAEGASVLKLITFAMLGALFLASFFRKGPRDFLSTAFSIGGHGDHSHGGHDESSESSCCASEVAAATEATPQSSCCASEAATPKAQSTCCDTTSAAVQDPPDDGAKSCCSSE